MKKIVIRYKALKSGKYSIYLDKNTVVDRYEFLRIYVSRDYSKRKGIFDVDRDAVALAESIRAKRQFEYYTDKNLDDEKRVNLYLIVYMQAYYHQTKRRFYKGAIYQLEAYCEKPPLISDITSVWIEKFRDFLLSRVSRNTTNGYLSTLCMFMNKAKREEIIEENPFNKVKIPSIVYNKRTALTIDEIRKLAQTPTIDRQIELAFLFACFTGLRLSDVLKLSYNEIHVVKDAKKTLQMLSIRPFKTRRNGKLLNIPLCSQAEKILWELEKIKHKSKKNRTNSTNMSGLVFDKLPCPETMNKELKKWAKNVNIDKRLHFHISRHSFAMMCLSQGMDIYSLSKLLGHSDIRHTQLYSSITGEKQLGEADKFPEFDFQKITIINNQ